jgi:hypothetical protein
MSLGSLSSLLDEKASWLMNFAATIRLGLKSKRLTHSQSDVLCLIKSAFWFFIS